MNSLDLWPIPPEAWKKARTRITNRLRRGLHTIEVNPGPHAFKLRYDYILTAAEVTTLVEEVMRETERLTVWHIEKRAERPGTDSGGTNEQP